MENAAEFNVVKYTNQALSVLVFNAVRTLGCECLVTVKFMD